MGAPPGRWVAGIVLRRAEIEALRAGRRVTKTYPEPFPHGPPPLSPEDFDAMRQGKSVTKMAEHWPSGTLRVGDVLAVVDPAGPRRPPPTFGPEELAALRAGETLTRTPTQRPPHGGPLPGLRVQVVEYRQEGPDHVYVLEPVLEHERVNPPSDASPR